MHPFQRTIDALARSHNEAATPTLVAALDADDRAVFDGAIAGLVARRCKAGHLEVLRRWQVLSDDQKLLVEKGRTRMGGALRDALLADDDRLFDAAYEFVATTCDYDLLPTLVMVAEQPGPRTQKAVSLTLELVECLAAIIAAPPQVGDRDPETTRFCVLESLERSVERFRQHQRAELIEAFVVLAGPNSDKLQAIINSPHHPCFRSVLQALTESQSPRVLQLLLTMLTGREAPSVIRNVVAKRADKPFVDALLAVPLDLNNLPLRRNLAKLKALACCDAKPERCTSLTPEQQFAAMRLLASSGVCDEAKLDFAQLLLAQGSVLGRISACTALQAVAGQRSNELVLLALKDDEPLVQAAAVRQLRDRHIPGALAKLMALVSSPHEVVAEAARQSLSEFTFDSYLSRFDALEEGARRTMGSRVARIDQNSVARLREELACPIRRQRLRALEMADCMGLFPKIADSLVERLADEDHMVRAAAADALRFCTAGDVRNALLAAVGDRSVAVQNAARSSLRALGIEKADAEAENAAAAEEALP